MLLTLRSLGWAGVEPDAWEDPDGCEWHFNPDLSDEVGEICDALAQSVIKGLWNQATQHTEGECLKDGGDLTMLRLN
eukprot:9032248-Pyramimonas_sp.AAC.1